jgi:hypothetical protein
MDDDFVDHVMDLYLNFRRHNNVNNEHNVSINECDNDDATNEDSKVNTGESNVGE